MKVLLKGEFVLLLRQKHENRLSPGRPLVFHFWQCGKYGFGCVVSGLRLLQPSPAAFDCISSRAGKVYLAGGICLWPGAVFGRQKKGGPRCTAHPPGTAFALGRGCPATTGYMFHRSAVCLKSALNVSMRAWRVRKAVFRSGKFQSAARRAAKFTRPLYGDTE